VRPVHPPLVFCLLMLSACDGCGSMDYDERGLDLPLYDDFESEIIDRALWYPGEHVREIRDGEVALETRHDLDDGEDIYLRADVRTPPFEEHHEVLARVKLVDHEVSGAQARAAVELNYQDEDDWLAGLDQSYVAARSEIRSGGSGLEWAWYVFGCANSDCTQGYPFPDPVGELPAEPPQPDTWYDLGVAFDEYTSTFTLTIDDATATVDASDVAAFEPDDFLQVRISSRVTGLDDSADRGFAAARADDVEIDGAPFDDFSGDELDLDRWRRGDLVRELQDGAFASVAADDDEVARSRLVMADSSGVEALYAQIALDEHTASGSSRARIGCALYHSEGSGEGQGGDVWAELGLWGDEARAEVFRCTDPDCDQVEWLTDAAGEDGFPVVGQAAMGEVHGLLVQWDGAELVFQLDDQEPLRFDPVAAGAPVEAAQPALPRCLVGTRVDPDESQPGRAAARVLEVRAGGALDIP